MKVKTLEDLFLTELKDLYSAESQILKALPKIIAHATSEKLKTALSDHLKETEGQVMRLDKIAEKLDKKLTGHKCKAMEGLLEEGSELFTTMEPGEVMDAALIGACQRVEHYEMAAYGCARTYAEQLGQTQFAKLLQETLDEEGGANKKLNLIATKEINQQVPSHK